MKLKQQAGSYTVRGKEKNNEDLKKVPSDSDDMKKIRALKAAILFLLLIIAGLTIAIALVNYEFRDSTNLMDQNTISNKRKMATTFKDCTEKVNVIRPGLDNADSIFHELNLTEIQNVKLFMEKQKNIKNVYQNAYGNSIFLIDVFYPTKNEVLNYRDRNGVRPVRKARVVILTAINKTSDYVVWPVHQPAHYKLIEYTDRSNPLPDNPTQSIPSLALNLQRKLILAATIKLWSLLQDTYEDFQNITSVPYLLRHGIWMAFDQHFKQKDKGGERLVGAYFHRMAKFEKLSNYLKYTMLYYVINATSYDWTKWYMSEVIYNKKSYSIDNLVNAYKNKSLKIVKVPSMTNEEHRREKPYKRNTIQNIRTSEPKLFAPNGPRFSIEGRTITYFDWQFVYGVKTLTGPGIYDVRYRGERIAYEISMQEAASFYGSGEQFFSNSNLFYSEIWLGYTNPLVKGVDCPEHAVYLDSVFYHSYAPFVVKDAICVFETNNQLPLRRYKKPFFKQYMYGGVTQHALVVRFIVNTKMYYKNIIFDYVFHQNGAVEVKNTATGTLFTSSDNDNLSNGYTVHNKYVGLISDDFNLFKVDLDILGQKNSARSLNIEAKLDRTPQTSDSVLRKKLVAKELRFESDAAIRSDSNSSDYFIIYNQAFKNMFKSNRGYRIQLLNSHKQIYPDDHIITRSAEWSKYKIAITKYKENERTGSCFLNALKQTLPARCSFDKRIIDNDNLVDEDLVAWVTIGGQHIPSTEDFPTVTTVGNQYSFIVRPFNYFNEDPSMTSGNSVYLERLKSNNYTLKAYTYGVTSAESTCPLPKRSFL